MKYWLKGNLAQVCDVFVHDRLSMHNGSADNKDNAQNKVNIVHTNEGKHNVSAYTIMLAQDISVFKHDVAPVLSYKIYNAD